MGATNFYEFSSGETSTKAFNSAVKNAQYEHGHGGYTGTIAEKSSFTMASEKSLTREEAFSLANSLMDTQYSNKWGPAGCIPIKSSSDISTTYLFFGWASE